MASQYDSISEKYRESKDADWRVHIEIPSFMRLVGDVSGMSVLDLACGDGFYSRRLKQQGARRVVGVDNSTAMIALARAAEDAEPLGVEYVVRDAERLELGEQFDVVVAAFLLNYAPSAAVLTQMCRAITRHLKPGGRFVTVNSNPEIGGRQVDYRRYGFERLASPDLANGSPYVFRNHQRDTSFDITIHHLDLLTHEEAFASAGLTDVRWVRPEVSDDGLEGSGADHWETFLRDPPIILIECRVETPAAPV